MSVRHPANATLTGVLLLACAACADTPIMPEPLQAAQAQIPVERLGDRELLLAVLSKLDAMESRLVRYDSLLSSGALAVAAATDWGAGNPWGGGGTGTGAGGGSGGASSADVQLLVSRTDSLMNLASFIADDVATPFQGFEVCGALDLKLAELEFKARTEGTAEAQGGVGVKPWDTGGLAQITLGQRVDLGLGVGVELGAGAEACWDLTDVGSAPPIRPASAALMAAANAPPQLEATVMAIRGQLGLDVETLEQALATGHDVYSSGDLSGLAQIANSLEVPSALRNPLGHVRSRLASFDAVSLLCSGTNFGARYTTLVSQGCGFIQSNDLPQLEPYLRVGSNLSSLTGQFTSLQSRFGGVCNRVNNIVDRQVTISLPSSLPSVEMRLFPTGWQVSC